MKNSFLFVLLTAACFLYSSCSEKESESASSGNDPGSIYGRVTDAATGTEVANANVTLLPGGETTLTGYDGTYEFYDVEDGDYRIKVSKAEYVDLTDDYVLNVTRGKRIRRDLQIERIPASLQLTDVDGNTINSIDFGAEPSSVVRAFNIFNNGTINIACNIVYSCVWIKSVSSLPDIIAPGQTVAVSVEIDRSKLVAGENITILYINSTHGNNALMVKATGQENIPVVITLPVTNPDGTQGPYRNTFHGNVTNIGYPPYSKRGFCWSSTNSTPTVSDYNVEVPGSGLGEYSYSWWDTPIPTTPVTYYVRAWVKYGIDNVIVYGNVQPYIFNDF